jgi:hypothetical protein
MWHCGTDFMTTSASEAKRELLDATNFANVAAHENIEAGDGILKQISC